MPRKVEARTVYPLKATAFPEGADLTTREIFVELHAFSLHTISKRLSVAKAIVPCRKVVSPFVAEALNAQKVSPCFFVFSSRAAFDSNVEQLVATFFTLEPFYEKDTKNNACRSS